MGIAALAVGALFYVVARSPGSTLVPLPDAGGLHWAVTDTVPVLGALPSLLHVFAFGLLLAAAIGLDRRAALLGPAAWLLVDALFEWLQIPASRSAVRAWLDETPAPVLGDWLLSGRGTFDPMDLAGLCVGAALASFVIARIRKTACRESHHAQS